MAPTSLTTVYSHPAGHLSGLPQPFLSSLLAQVTVHSCVQVLRQKPSMTPMMVWSGRKDCQHLILRHMSLRRQRGSGLSIVPMLSKIRPDLAIPDFGLTPPLTSHSQDLPRHSYPQSSEPCPQSNPGALLSPSPMDSWHMALPAGFKGTPGRGAPQSTKRTAWLPQKAFDQRARRCLGNHLAPCLLVDETEAQREEGTGLPLAHRVPLFKLVTVPVCMAAVLGQRENSLTVKVVRISGQQTASLCTKPSCAETLREGLLKNHKNELSQS